MQKRLSELNRRLRRRMVTRGAVSLDVEDSLNEEDWPHLQDVTLDMLRFSVHFPLEPRVSEHFLHGTDIYILNA